MIALTGFERSVLSWLDFEGSMRLMEVVDMVNPAPDSRRAIWFGGTAMDEWKARTVRVCEAMWGLESEGPVECVRRRKAVEDAADVQRVRDHRGRAGGVRSD